MKILYLSGDPGIDLAGQSGGSIHIRAFIRALTDLGHEVAVVCTSITGSPRELEADLKASLYPAPLARWNRFFARKIQAANRLMGKTPRHHPDLARLLHNLSFFRVARTATREFFPDFVYERYSLWGVAGLALARHHGIPIGLEVNAPLAYEQQRYRSLSFPALAHWAERMVWRRADLVFAVSEPLSQHLHGSGVPWGRIRLLPNGVDTRLFRVDRSGDLVRKRLGLAERFVVGFTGSFKPWHGVDFLLKAFEDLYRSDCSAHLLLVGDGPLRASLEDQVRKARLQGAVTFAGLVAHEEMPDYVAAMDAAVAPYPPLEHFYYSPLKLFEYMAAGRVVIASRVGQIAEFVEDSVTGLTFEPGDLAGLVNCIRRAGRDAALRRDLGRRAADASRDHTWTRNATRVTEWAEALRSEQPLPLTREGEARVA